MPATPDIPEPGPTPEPVVINPPTDFVGVGTSTSTIKLTWKDNSNNENNFRIQRKTTNGVDDYVVVATLPANTTQYEDTGLASNTRYNYILHAVRDDVSAKAPNLLGVQTLAIDPQPLPDPPLAPTDFNGVAKSTSRVDLFWTDVANDEAAYEVFRRTRDGGDPMVRIAVLDPNVATYVDTGLNRRWVYVYQVKAVNEFGSAASPEIHVQTLADDPVVTVNPPTNVAATATAPNKVSVAWTDNSNNEAGFKVERKTGTGSFSVVAELAPNVLAYQDNNVPAGTYVYRVVAFAGTVTAPSSEVTVVVTDPVPVKVLNKVTTVVNLVTKVTSTTYEYSDGTSETVSKP
jgi:hypothetical protein